MSRKLKYMTIPVITGKSIFRSKLGLYKDNPVCQFKVYWCYEWEEYQVDLYINGRQHTKSCYCTSNLDDACNTANELAQAHDVIK